MRSLLTMAVGIGLFTSVAAQAGGGVSLSTKSSSKTEHIQIIRDTHPSSLETRTYKLKHADPYIIAQILNEALATAGTHGKHGKHGHHKRPKRNPVMVTPLKYEDGTGAVIVTAPRSVFGAQDNDKKTGLDNIIREIDRPDAKLAKDTVIYYQPKNRSASGLAKAVENFFRKEGVIITVDPKSNKLLIAGPPFTIKNVAKQLEKLDIAPTNYRIKYQVLIVDLNKVTRVAATTDSDIMWIGTDFRCSMKDFDLMLKDKKAVSIMSGSLVVSSKKAMILNTEKVESGDTSLSPGCSMKVLVFRPRPGTISLNVDSSVIPSKFIGTLKNEESHIAVNLLVDETESSAVIGGGVLSASESARIWLQRTFSVSDIKSGDKFQMVLIVHCRKE